VLAQPDKKDDIQRVFKSIKPNATPGPGKQMLAQVVPPEVVERCWQTAQQVSPLYKRLVVR
jgi:hypothetical protein